MKKKKISYIPRNEISRSYFGSILIVWENSILSFPQWMCQFAFPPTMNKGSFLCRKIQPIFVICAVSGDSDSDRYEMTFHCGCDFHLMMVPFMYLLAIYISSLEKKNIYVYLVLLLIFNLIFWFLILSLWSAYTCLIFIPYQLHHLQIFSLIQ